MKDKPIDKAWSIEREGHLNKNNIVFKTNLVKQKEKKIMKDKLPNLTNVDIRVLYSLDEERGYLLDTEEMRRQFEEKLSKLEDEVSELNETWQEKQKEYGKDMGFGL